MARTFRTSSSALGSDRAVDSRYRLGVEMGTEPRKNRRKWFDLAGTGEESLGTAWSCSTFCPSQKGPDCSQTATHNVSEGMSSETYGKYWWKKSSSWHAARMRLSMFVRVQTQPLQSCLLQLALASSPGQYLLLFTSSRQAGHEHGRSTSESQHYHQKQGLEVQAQAIQAPYLSAPPWTICS